MWKLLKRIINIVFWVVVSVALTISLNGYFQRSQGIQQPMMFGYGFAVVETGSMEPNVPVGSLIIIKDTGSYEAGDIITYTNSYNVSVTHRVVNIHNGLVTARGDANDLSDPVFKEEAISGKVIYTNLKAGKVLKKLQSPIVMWVFIVLVILSFIWDIVSSFIKKKKKLSSKNYNSVATDSDKI